MILKLYDSELKVMEVLWQKGDSSAKQIAELLAKQIQWSKTTTYTVLKKCVDKGAVQRNDPGFLCHALLTREQVQMIETDELINKLYSGAADQLVASILQRKPISKKELERLKRLVDELDRG